MDLADVLGPPERWPALTRERFAILDRLTREGRCREILAAGQGPDAWERLADAAAGLRPAARPPVRRRGTRNGHHGPTWPAMVWSILGALDRPGGARLADAARAAERFSGQVYTALVLLECHGVVERRGRRWTLVRHPRPW